MASKTKMDPLLCHALGLSYVFIAPTGAPSPDANRARSVPGVDGLIPEISVIQISGKVVYIGDL